MGNRGVFEELKSDQSWARSLQTAIWRRGKAAVRDPGILCAAVAEDPAFSLRPV